MKRPTNPQPDLATILTQILLMATRMLRDLQRHATTTTILKSILAANLAAARIGRAVSLTTLLIRRIADHGPGPLPPHRPRAPQPPLAPGTIPAPRAPRAHNGPRLHTGNIDAAFARRPLPTVIAAITRELRLAAQILEVPLPESLLHLCLNAAFQAAPFAEPPAPPSHTPSHTPTTPAETAPPLAPRYDTTDHPPQHQPTHAKPPNPHPHQKSASP